MSIKMNHLPITERPYEKLEQNGEKTLTNAELLAIIIKSGTKEESSIQLAQRILTLSDKKDKNNLSFLREITIEELTKIKGIGKVKAIQIKAICELASRMNGTDKLIGTRILKTQDIGDLLFEEMRYETQEILKVAILDNKNKLLKIKDIAKGAKNFVNANIQIIFHEILKTQALKFILIHNHPSGDTMPSKSDIEFTKRIIQASKILELQFLDHIIIGNYNYISIFAKIEELGRNV